MQTIPHTSDTSSPATERPVRSIAPASARVDQLQPSLTNAVSPSFNFASHPGQQPPENGDAFGLFSSNSFDMHEEKAAPYTLDCSTPIPQTPVESQHSASAQPICNYTGSPLTLGFSESPVMSPYGLGFSCKLFNRDQCSCLTDYAVTSIPGFQASSVQTMRNQSKHPGKVIIPRKNYSSFSGAPDTPLYSSNTCSPLGFPIFSAPASVTSFPNYIQ